MSILALLAFATTGTPTPPTAIDLRPAPADATVALLRPSGRSIATLRVGPTRTHTTIGSAITAAQAAQAAQLSTEGQATITPNYRVDILVDAGTYVETITTPKWVGVYAVDPTPGATVITHTNPAGVPTSVLGTLATAGALYWEGIDIHLDKPFGEEGNWPKYPVHHVSSRTSIFARTRFRTRTTAGAIGAGLTTFGTDGAGGSTTVFYDCDFDGGGTNNHGWPGNTAPQTWAYVDCTATHGVNYSALGGSLADEVWVKGGSVGSVDVDGSGTVTHLAPASGATLTTTGTQDARTDWPIPTGGLSAIDRAYYGM